MNPETRETDTIRGPSRPLLPRVLAALRLRPETFDEVARDPRAGFQAGLLVVIVGVLEASVHSAVHHHSEASVTLVGEGVLAALIGWFLWSAIVWVIGARSYGYDVPFSEVLRGVGFAHAPSLFYGLGVIPGVTRWSGLLYASTLLWFAAAGVAATEGVFRVARKRAAGIFVLALLAQLFLREVLPYAFRLVPGLAR